MTQTLQQALLKAGLITQDKLKKAEADKRQAQRAQRQQIQRPAVQHSRQDSRGAPRRDSRPPRPAPAEAPQKKSVGFIEGKHHHHMRTECAACGKTSPDVEYYEHKNRSLDKYWLCVKCADDHNIHDDFRQTVQSTQSMKGLFQRGYGPTKIFRKK